VRRGLLDPQRELRASVAEDVGDEALSTPRKNVALAGDPNASCRKNRSKVSANRALSSGDFASVRASASRRSGGSARPTWRATARPSSVSAGDTRTSACRNAATNRVSVKSMAVIIGSAVVA
jgi:hypothetical protein